MNEQPENQQVVFVVHKRQATTLHYDFHLEIGGVMPSWAIPKGPTLDSHLKRLAMPTTDHTAFVSPLRRRVGRRPIRRWSGDGVG